MRAIKFRGWNKVAECWCFGYSLKDADVKDRWYIMDNYSDGIIVEKESVGQFTGLQDKNGKDVYEGDIMRLKHEDYLWEHIGVVKYGDTGRFYFDTDGYIPDIVHPGHIYEIIGNIYESPELLNPSKQ